MKRNLLLALMAAAALSLAIPAAHAGSPNRSDWTGTSTNNAQVNGGGIVNNPQFSASINGTAGNITAGANASASFNTLARNVPDMGRTTISLTGINNGQVNGGGVINNPTATLTYGTSFVNGTTGAGVGFSHTAVGVR
jgi:ABC-type oligopeptide transport system substrate-binding subunit